MTYTVLAFQNFFCSNLFLDIFSENFGISLEDGEKWHNIRSKVQQDLMRPKSATFYLDKIQDIADEFVRYIQRNRDPGTCQVSKSDIITSSFS